MITVAPIFADKPFFMSDEFTLVDCCVAPILWRLKYMGVKLPERQARPDAQVHARVIRPSRRSGEALPRPKSKCTTDVNSSRPYLVNALIDWISDNDCTPFVVVAD